MRFLKAIPLFLFPAAGFFLFGCGSENKNYLNLNDSVHYVGINTCRQCHMDIYRTFIKTGMGQSFGLASRAKSAALFEPNTVVHDSFLNFSYHPYWEKDSFKIAEFRLAGKDTVYKRIEKVDYIIGSGQHTNSHMFSVNGYLHQIPITYYTQKGTWDLPPGFENGTNTRFSRKIGLECMSCHNALPGFVEGSENKFDFVPEGINCERCHGPGSAHVALKQKGVLVDTSREIDYSIVNPAKLSIDLQFDVCQRCHLQGNAVLKEGKSFFDFRPGMHLNEVMTVFLPKYKGADEEFIMASHADRLKRSECFIKSAAKKGSKTSLKPYRESLTCVTCHNPHVSVKFTDKSVFNSACINCHGNKVKTTCTEKPETRNASQDNCVGCHMPKSGSTDIPHVRITDHYIRKPVAAGEKEKIKKFIGLIAINEKNPASKTKAIAYINQFEKFDMRNTYLLDSARHYLLDTSPGDILENFPQLVQLAFFRQDFRQILNYVSLLGSQKLLATYHKKSFSNDDAWTLYRVGESYLKSGNAEQAFAFFKRAEELAPFSPDFQNKTGAALMALNRVKEAEHQFRQILSEDPEFSPAYCNLGYIHFLSGNLKLAESEYNRALALDPDYEQAVENKAGLYLAQNDKKKAKQVLTDFLKFHPDNKQIRLLLTRL